MTVLSTPEQIARFHFASQRTALRLELLGMKTSRGSVYALVKRQYSLRGTRANVLGQMEHMLETNTIPQSLIEAIKRQRGEA